MLGFLTAMKHWPIALDMGTESIKMLQLGRSSGRIGLCACGRWHFPEPGEIDPARRKELAIEAIGDLLRKGKFHGRKIISALSTDQLSIKNIRVPHASSDELKKLVMWEAKERFNFDIGPDELNYLNAGQVRQDNDIQDEIIMIATRAEAVEEHLDLLSKAGLVPEAVDVESVAVFRAFERFYRRRADEQCVSVIVDIGYGSTRVVVARGPRIVFIKNIDIGGCKLSTAVADQLDLTLSEANALRMRRMHKQDVSSGEQAADDDAAQSLPEDRNNVEWTIHDAIRGEVEALAKEISLCLRYCSVTFRGLRPKEVTLTGGETYDQAMIKLLKEELGIPCVVGQPLKGIDTSAVDLGADRRGAVAEWAVCAGLAMRGVDFGRSALEEDGDERRRLSA